MKKYKSFIQSDNLDKLVIILEGYLSYSPLFKEKLFTIRDKSKVADVLYDMSDEYYEDDDLKYNYINTTDAEDKVSFISQKKATQIEDNASKLGVEDEIDFFTAKGRVDIAVGRLVRSLGELGGEKFTDKDIELFVNQYKSKTKSVGEKFKLVKGPDIAKWYDESTYYDGYGEGSLDNSCMKDEPSDYFDIYSYNGSCQMLILTKTDKNVFGKVDKLIGRALVWKLKEGPKGVKYFMDRIYCMRDSDSVKFENYADEQGWLRKKKQNSVSTDGVNFIFKGKDIKSKISVEIDSSDLEYYPFVDTLSFINDEHTLLSNIGFAGGNILMETDGSLDKCGNCNGTGNGSCSSCKGTHEMDCPDCRGRGEVTCDECDGNSSSCPECDGNGFIGCDECMGDGDYECGKCEGSGEIDGTPCDECKGEGMIVCGGCEGEGGTTCEKCDGSGNGTDCNVCGGTGEVPCEKCDGDGEVKCTKCDESDTSDKGLCPECTGLIKLLST